MEVPAGKVVTDDLTVYQLEEDFEQEIEAMVERRTAHDDGI